ncbi:chaperone NapD [Kiloniella laminariae]|uniref:Chaperone NapD n=1 Tax=Kiloniella laminariae TaxID=454162 RepID=A0ABT4LLW7_9PROT|nr:chaperone NapD [Kiloniella laminariae]MCZ4282115.1 chaperone NapD [Kiloniella laminariae]
MNDETDLFISSHIARISPDNFEKVLADILKHPFADVPLVDDKGKVVILIDAPTSRDAVSTIDSIRTTEGVYSFSPVYQHEEA